MWDADQMTKLSTLSLHASWCFLCGWPPSVPPSAQWVALHCPMTQNPLSKPYNDFSLWSASPAQGKQPGANPTW